MSVEPAPIAAPSALGYPGKHVHWTLFAAILAAGVFARAWEFGRLPPGLNPDETSIAVEAYSLLHFGVDRNGMSYPVQFIAWGDGQSVPYAYLMMPGIALTGHVSPTTIRLPMLITGILSLPLVYLVGKWTVDRGFGLLAMFFLAISPWHIVLSRWALDANLLPFSFLVGFACLLASARNGRWFIAACFVFALCLYAYATAYAVIPIFMALILLTNWRTRMVRAGSVILGLTTFAVVAAPMALFILVNTAHLNSIRMGPITIPRYPVTPRYETQTLLGPSGQSETWLTNLGTAGGLLWTQSDGFIQNTVEPYGYFYRITCPLALLGIVVLARLTREHSHAWAAFLMLSWMAASMIMALLLPVNTNQFNIVFIPMILSIALSVAWISSRLPVILPLSIVALAIAFIAFTLTYHGQAYRYAANIEFRTGILPALEYAAQKSTGSICVTSASGQYIYVLYLEHADPASYLSKMKYDYPSSRDRNVISLGRYTFGMGNCTGTEAWTYVLATGDNLPRLGNRYDYKFFDNYVVYYPKQ